MSNNSENKTKPDSEKYVTHEDVKNFVSGAGQILEAYIVIIFVTLGYLALLIHFPLTTLIFTVIMVALTYMAYKSVLKWLRKPLSEEELNKGSHTFAMLGFDSKECADKIMKQYKSKSASK